MDEKNVEWWNIMEQRPKVIKVTIRMKNKDFGIEEKMEMIWLFAILAVVFAVIAAGIVLPQLIESGGAHRGAQVGAHPL